MAASLAGVFLPQLQEKILESKILVVGAGGIGCEVLKNLVMTGFSDIEIIDLDTIDVSNLNRQFLFHKEHVGKSKAEVARESALAFNPNVTIKAYRGSITAKEYGVGFFQSFKLVLNALDNRQARNHVNRMCLTAKVPLIESGTAGYDGQVELIQKGRTQCYECTPKSAQKSFPGCTIRNTPSEPIHCIVWAKHLFNQLFGEHNEDEDVSPDSADPEAVASAGDAALVTQSNESGNITRVSTRKWAEQENYDAAKIFNKLFCDDIKYLLSMSDLWKSRTPPTPLRYGEFDDDVTSMAKSTDELQLTGNSREQKVWDLRECQSVFATSLLELQREFQKLTDDNLIWDKDDKAAMDFVAACANVRAIVFNIQRKSRFEIKSMAGNIIPAIATTNAITAGIVVMRAFNVLQDQIEQCQSVYVRLRLNARGQKFVPDRTLMKPNPKCIVCSAKPEVVIRIDTKRVTVKQFRDEVLIKALNMIDPDVIVDGKGVILISSEEDETECNNEKLLSDMEIVDGCILKVDDFHQDYELGVIISHKDVDREGSLFDIIADPDTIKAENNPSAEAEASTSDGAGSAPEPKKRRVHTNDNDDDDLCLIEEDDEECDSNEKAGTSGLGSVSRPQSTGAEVSSSIDVDDDVCITLDDDDSGDQIKTNRDTTPKKRRVDIDNGEPSPKRSKTDDAAGEILVLDDE